MNRLIPLLLAAVLLTGCGVTPDTGYAHKGEIGMEFTLLPGLADLIPNGWGAVLSLLNWHVSWDVRGGIYAYSDAVPDGGAVAVGPYALGLR